MACCSHIDCVDVDLDSRVIKLPSASPPSRSRTASVAMARTGEGSEALAIAWVVGPGFI